MAREEAPEPRVLDAFPGLPGVRAFFTTRIGGWSRGAFDALNLGMRTGDDPEIVKRNWGHLLESQGVRDRAEAIVPRLRHGIAMVEDREASDAEADAVFSHAAGRPVAVTTADCLAALVADPESGCVAAVHAGWRGTRDDILGRALARLFAEGRCRPETTRVALGPCLSTPALEIGEDVAATLPREHVHRIDGRTRFDLRGCNRAQAIAAGVLPANIAEIGGCTHANPRLFFSHRRDAGITGRMAACVMLL